MPKPLRYDNQIVLLYIDSYNNDIPVGRFYSPCLGEAGTFRSMSQMLRKIDQCLNIQDAPQAFNSVRSFSSVIAFGPEPAEETDTRPGGAATFTLQFLFRRHASWQGNVTWMETRQTAHFRSALELIYLITGALSEAQMPDPELAGFAKAYPEAMEG